MKAASGAVLNGDGSRWWDGEGSNGGVTKPKFFYAHNMDSSSITGLTIQNSPVQVFSINGATDLTLTDITIDDSDGDTDDLGHNTDCFDIGSSTGVTISGATCKNQDDCVAINSGEVTSTMNINSDKNPCLPMPDHHLHRWHMFRRPRTFRRLSGRAR